MRAHRPRLPQGSGGAASSGSVPHVLGVTSSLSLWLGSDVCGMCVSVCVYMCMSCVAIGSSPFGGDCGDQCVPRS